MGGFFGLLAVIAILAVGLNTLGVLPLMFLSGMFTFGTLGFWALVAVESVLLLIFLEHDSRKQVGFWATVSLVLTLLLLQQFGDVKIFTSLKEHPLNFLLWVLGYFVVGTLWSLGKWWFYLREMRERYDAEKKDFLEENKVSGDVIPENLKKEWASSMRSYYYRPEVSKHKSLIMMWMAYWPWSAVWTLINDPIKRLFNEIFAQLRRVYEAMRDKAFSGTENDFKRAGKDEDER